MASEVAIREEIVAQIKEALVSFTPAAVVIGRDILNVFDSGWYNVLRDEDGLGKIHGWTVTQNGAVVIEERQGGAEYELLFDVWQWDQYRTGTDASNSENQSSAERDAVINKFKDAKALPEILSRAHPIEFERGSIATVETDFRGQVRLGKGLLRVGNVYGCV